LAVFYAQFFELNIASITPLYLFLLWCHGLTATDLFFLQTGRFACSPPQKLKPIGSAVVDQLDIMQPYKLMDQKVSFGLDDKLFDVKLPPSSWREDQDPANQRDSFPKPLVSPLKGTRGSLNGTQYESGLFSSSLPDIFDKKSEPSYFVSYILFG
jgi:hypothetical protein